MDYANLSAMQLDALKEVCNIGVGNAATALSQLLGRTIDMTVPSVNVVPFDNILEDVGEEETAIGVVVRVLGNTPGNILIVFHSETIFDIVYSLTGVKDKGLNELSSSVICEIGNILSGAFMNSLALFTNLSNMPSVPAVSYDMTSAILSTTFIESGQYDDYVLDLETEFIQGTTKTNSGHFYYIPMPGSLEKILNTLGVN